MKFEVLDLSHIIEEGMLKFDAAWHPDVCIEQMGTLEKVGRNTRKLALGSHTGTHMDAPLHFVCNGKSVDEIPLKTLVGKVSILDFTDLGENEPLTKERLEKEKFGPRVICKFGWGKMWGTKKFYKGYPFFSEEAAKYMLRKNVILVGMDTPSPDDSRIDLSGGKRGTCEDSPIHKIFLQHCVVLVEYIANLDKVHDYKGWNLSVMPLKIKGSDGSPARVCIFRGVLK